MRATVFYNPPALAKANFVPVAAVRKEKVFLSPILPDSENFPPTCPQYHFILDSLLWDGVASPSRPTVHVHATFACTCTPLAGGSSEFQLNVGVSFVDVDVLSVRVVPVSDLGMSGQSCASL